MASLAVQRPANDARGFGARRQYACSRSVKLRAMNSSLSMLMASTLSTSTPTREVGDAAVAASASTVRWVCSAVATSASEGVCVPDCLVAVGVTGSAGNFNSPLGSWVTRDCGFRNTLLWIRSSNGARSLAMNSLLLIRPLWKKRYAFFCRACTLAQ
ncbi:hypothetical protein VTN31DRAFT_620 [Thermomyces dupontii]|uniref:uncharacterized protein n=1 Tax=Talaromyces thermophilus TaxID=28565 RepID=UPI00374281D2